MGLLFWGFSLLVLYFGYQIIVDSGIFKVIYTHYPGQCQTVKGISGGSEDMAAVPDTDYALITSGLYAYWTRNPTARKHGAVFLYNMAGTLNTAEKLKIMLSPQFKQDEFYPHGVSIIKNKEGQIKVFAINSKTHTVERFQLILSEKLLVHEKSFSDPLFRAINNLVALDEETFYISNWLYYFNPIMANLEFLLKLPFSNVLYYDGTGAKVVIHGLKGANGITLTKNKKNLVVVVNSIQELHIYKIKSPTELQLTDKINLHSALDNLNIDEEGRVLIGSHPVGYKILMHMHSPTTYSAPSQVLRVTLDKSEEKFGKVEEIFSDNGELIQGSTVGLVMKKKMLIGTISHKAAICEMNI